MGERIFGAQTLEPALEVPTGFTHRADRILAGLVADGPNVLLAIALLRGADDVLAARARVERGPVVAEPGSGPRPALVREVISFVTWARAYARLDATVRCEALSAHGDTTWAVQARGTSGRVLVAVVSPRSALASNILESARRALFAIERSA